MAQSSALINEITDQELSIDQLAECSGGMIGIIVQFGKAVSKGVKEIKEVQETGELPERFNTPYFDVGSGDSGSNEGSTNVVAGPGDCFSGLGLPG